MNIIAQRFDLVCRAFTTLFWCEALSWVMITLPRTFHIGVRQSEAALLVILIITYIACRQLCSFSNNVFWSQESEPAKQIALLLAFNSVAWTLLSIANETKSLNSHTPGYYHNYTVLVVVEAVVWVQQAIIILLAIIYQFKIIQLCLLSAKITKDAELEKRAISTKNTLKTTIVCGIVPFLLFFVFHFISYLFSKESDNAIILMVVVLTIPFFVLFIIYMIKKLKLLYSTGKAWNIASLIATNDKTFFTPNK